MSEEVSEENNEELESQVHAPEGEIPVETTQTSEAPANGTPAYKGTEGSKWGKIVVGMETPNGLQILDEGPEDKGFKTQNQAIEAIKKHVSEGMDNGVLDVANMPTFHVLRMVKEITPTPIQTTVLDFGEE